MLFISKTKTLSAVEVATTELSIVGNAINFLESDPIAEIPTTSF
jgi:hypothetical protein